MAQVVKYLPAKAGDITDVDLIPGLGRSPGEGNDDLLQYACLGNPMDRGAWWATFHGVAKNRTLLMYMLCVCLVCCVLLFVTLWTVARQASESMGSLRQEYWNGLPCPPRGDLPTPGIEPMSPVSPALQADSLALAPPGQRRQWHPAPVLLPGKSHGWRSLVGCSPWGR